MSDNKKSPVPKGMHTVTPQIWFDGNCREAIDFYQKALGMKLISDIIPGPGGEGVLYALLAFGSSKLIVADSLDDQWEHSAEKGTTVSFYVYVADADAVFNRAVEEGAEALMPMIDAFWGDRSGQIRDPFGHIWYIATKIEEVSHYEIKERHKDYVEKKKKAP